MHTHTAFQLTEVQLLLVTPVSPTLCGNDCFGTRKHSSRHCTHNNNNINNNNNLQCPPTFPLQYSPCRAVHAAARGEAVRSSEMPTSRISYWRTPRAAENRTAKVFSSTRHSGGIVEYPWNTWHARLSLRLYGY